MKTLILVLALFSGGAHATHVFLERPDGRVFHGVVVQDGWVMTVAHGLSNHRDGGVCIQGKPRDCSTRAYLAKAGFRVGQNDQDIALVEIPTGGVAAVEIAEPGVDGALAVGTEVTYDTGKATHSVVIRDLLAKKGSRSTLPNMVYTSDEAHAGPGDSGSPLFTKDGKLVGMLVGARSDLGVVGFTLAGGESGREVREAAFGPLPAATSLDASEIFFSGSKICSLTFVERGLAVASANCMDRANPQARLARGGFEAKDFFFADSDKNLVFLSFEIDEHPFRVLGLDHTVAASREGWKVAAVDADLKLRLREAVLRFPVYSGSAGDVKLLAVAQTEEKQSGQLFSADGKVIGTLDVCDKDRCQYTSLFSKSAKETYERAKKK